MGTKNKERDQNKRRQKASLKATNRRKEVVRRAPAPPGPLGTRGGVPVVGTDRFSEESLLFWWAHGVNYILSDYTQGTWTPLFESIYEGSLIPSEEIARRVMERFAGMKEWPMEAKAAVAWVASDRAVVFIYHQEAMRRMRSAHPEVDDIEARLRMPHEPIVWGVFNFMKEKLLHKGVR